MAKIFSPRQFLNLSILVKIRLFWIALILFISALFLCLKIVPAGEATYEKDYGKWLRSGKGFIYNFTPVERVSENRGVYPRLVGDPVYFSVFTPRTFSQAKLTVRYRSYLTSSTPVIEAGVLADNLVWRYDLQPLENSILSNLEHIWHKVEGDDVILLQRKNNYQDINKFLDDVSAGGLTGCPGKETECLATYNYPLYPNFTWPEEDTSTVAKQVNIPLRGSHSLFIYLDGSEFNLLANFVDLNQDKAPDPARLILTDARGIVAEANFEDANLEPTSGQEEEKSLTLTKDNLSPGVYRLEFKIGNDMVIKNFNISTNRFVFANKFWPVSYGREIEIFTDANYLQVKAMGPASLHKFSFADKQFDLNLAYEQFDFIAGKRGQANQINLKKDDIVLENNGVFALSADSLFNPQFTKLDRYFRLDDNVQYVIANYEPAITIEETTEATATFRLKGVYREKGKYNFMISVPGLKTDNGQEDYLEIESVKIEFAGRNLWQKIFRLDDGF